MTDIADDAVQLPQQVWPDAFVARYRTAGYWRGETFPAFMRERAARHGDRIAVVGMDERWTYAELWQRSETIGAGLLALGLEPGDRVVVQMGNKPVFYAVVFGLFRAGLIPVYALAAHRITEVAHFARTAHARAYVALDQWEGFDYRVLAAELLARTDVPVEHAVIAGDAGPHVALDDLVPDRSLLPATDPDPQSVAFLNISGGTTGLSKLIPRTHDDYIYSFRASNPICGIDADSVYMVALPVAHNFPMSSPGAMGTFHAGGTVVVSPSAAPETAFALIEREHVTCLGLVPPLALLWTQAAAGTTHDLSSLKVLQVGGAKLTPEAARRVTQALPVTLQQVFGMAEGLVNYTRLDDDEDTILNTQGRPISPDDEILVVDDDGNPVPDGTVGYLLTRGPYTLRAYHNDDAANARSFTPDGFYRPGDMVVRRPDGYLVVHGRANDHINRAGEKISAEEIENHLLAHPDVFDAVVVSIPDTYLGECSCAFIIPREGANLRPPQVKGWMRERGIAPFKIPDRIVLTDGFATTAAGKISRKQLRARLRADYLEEKGLSA